MGKPNIRLNPQKKVGRGRRPYDYRIVLIDMLKQSKLPCKSTINYYAFGFKLNFLSNFNKKLIGRSIWYCIRTKKEILKKDCDKVHSKAL